MKKILLAVILLLLISSFASERATCKIEQKTLAPFTIMAKGSLVSQNNGMTRIYFDKPSPIVTYKDGQYTFFVFEKKVDNLGIYYKPKLDKNEEPITIKWNDPNYFSVISIPFLNYYLIGEIIGPQNIIILSLFVHIRDREDYSGYWLTLIYTKFESIKQWENSNKPLSSKINYPVGSIYYFDDDYNTELQLLTKTGYKIEKREAINPDLVDSESIPRLFYLENMISTRGQGYFWMKIGSQDIVVDGINYKMMKPFIYNGKLAISLYDLINIIGGEIEYNNTTGRYEAYRVVKPAWSKIEIIKLELKIGDKKAYLNGEEIELSIAPFEPEDRSSFIYVSAKDICDIFKAKLHWRSIDNTALIERFPARF